MYFFFQLWVGNIDADTIKTNHFNSSVQTRYLRIYPMHYKVYRCLRVEVYGCRLKQNGTLMSLATSSPTTLPYMVATPTGPTSSKVVAMPTHLISSKVVTRPIVPISSRGVVVMPTVSTSSRVVAMPTVQTSSKVVAKISAEAWSNPNTGTV